MDNDIFDVLLIEDVDSEDFQRLIDSDLSIEGQASAGSTVIPKSDANGEGSSAGGPSGQQPLSKKEQKEPKPEIQVEPRVEVEGGGCSSGRARKRKPLKREKEEPADDEEERELERVLKKQRLRREILEEEERILDLMRRTARMNRELAEQQQDCDEDGASASVEGASFLADF